jgi:hypothetical protein
MSMMKEVVAIGSRVRTSAGKGLLLALLAAVGMSLLTGRTLAQTGGDAALTGTVKDSTGAVVANATVTAMNVATGVETMRQTSSAGVYQISPLIVGTYTLTVSGAGFKVFRQENIVLNQGQTYGLNASLSLGDTKETVTVTEAPPQLDTANATLGGTITSQEFLDLPLLVSGNQQRDITTFSNLLPGAQVGSRSSLFSGTANRVQEVYLDGIPLTTISQIGDNRPIFNLVPAEAVGQIGATTSGASVEYQGAGSVNYSLKSGVNAYHGSIADFVRNTIFDTWGFTAPAATVPRLVNGVVTNVPAGKPIDHQNELTMSAGGPVRIPHLYDGRDKFFVFGAYDRVHTRSAPAYSQGTVPTVLMRQGNFTELLAANGGPGYNIYDPTLATCPTPTTCTRTQFNGTVNGIPTPNVIPASEISPIAKTMQSFLPAPSTGGIQNNYLGGNPSGYDNWLYSIRFDYTVSPKQTISGAVTGGNRKAYPFTSNSVSSVPSTVFPIPYIGTSYTQVAGHWVDLSDSYTITPNLVNQIKYGFSNFGGPPAQNVTQGVTPYEAQNMGIVFNNVPAGGQALTEFPTNVFAGSNEPTQWGAGSTAQSNTTVTETYTAVDNLLWLKGKHAMTFGFQFQWLEEQISSYDGPTSTLTLNYSVSDTAQESGTSYVSGSGYSYASYMMGAVNATSLTVQPFAVVGARYRPYAPYFQDDFKVTSKLTLNLGIRWDYLPPYQEAVARYSFLNPDPVTGKNPVTMNVGALEFAGNSGGSAYSCGCASPVSTYYKNFGPRVGFAYSVDDKTVFRGAFSTVYSHGGGTGGGGGAAATGPSQLGFNVTDNFPVNASAGPGAGPVFYLNNSNYNATLNNATFGGPGHVVPSPSAPGAVSQTLNVGNTVNAAGAFVPAGGAPGYADPYISGRAPEFNFWNFGMERQVTKDITVTANYAGSESHFIGGANMRGLQSGQINPIYYALGSTLTLAATPTNLMTANTKAAAAGLPAINLPYAGFGQAAMTTAGAGQATIYRALTWMPQFSGTTDSFGNFSANSVYHSFQLSVAKRASHGLTLNMNYTYSHNIDDAGTQRSGYAIPGNLLLSGKSWPVNRIDRSTSLNSVPENLTAYAVYNLPFGKGGIGKDSFIVRSLAGGWQISGIFTYAAGVPLALTSSSCSTSFQPTAGTCMPDLNPAFTGTSVRQNGSWGAGMTAKTLGTTRYINGYIPTTAYAGSTGVDSNGQACGSTSSSPFCNSSQFKFGDAPRTGAFGLRAPGVYNLNMSVRRTIAIVPDHVKFILGVDCQNVTNKVTFGGIGVGVNSSSFGTVSTATSNSGSRDFQFSGRLSF